MGQQIAKRKVEEGIKLYTIHNHEKAVEKWKKALKKIRRPRDRFATLGYLIAAYCDWGKYREMLEIAIDQIEVAKEIGNESLQADAYLNLARANEYLCEYQKSISYSVHCLENKTVDTRVHGYAYMCLGNAQLGFGNFSKALKYFNEALRRAKTSKDQSLQLQIFGCLGQLYTVLKDYETSLTHYLKAAELAKSFNVCDLNSKYQRQTCLNFAKPYQKLGRYEEAMESCEDALKMALSNHDRPIQGACLLNFADIHRSRNDIERSYPRYEAALSLMTEIGNKRGQAMCLLGMSKMLIQMKQFTKVLEINARALDIAETIGSKMEMLRCRMHIEKLYRALGDFDLVAEQLKLCNDLLEDMGLFCGVCGQVMGDKPEQLDTLQCYHLFHSRCMIHILSDDESVSSVDSNGKCHGCPTCATLPDNHPQSPTSHLTNLNVHPSSPLSDIIHPLTKLDNNKTKSHNFSHHNHTHAENKWNKCETVGNHIQGSNPKENNRHVSIGNQGAENTQLYAAEVQCLTNNISKDEKRLNHISLYDNNTDLET